MRYFLITFFICTNIFAMDFDIENLEKASMLYQSGELAKKYSGKKIQWKYQYGLPEPRKVCEKSSVWVDLYPLAIICEDNNTVLQTLAEKQLWDIFEEIGIQGIHTNPMKIAGGITSGRLTPTVDGGYDRISLKIDPQFGTKKQYIHLSEVAKSHGSIVIGDLVPGHTGLGPDFILAVKNYKDYPGIYHMVEIDENDWNLLPKIKGDDFSRNLSFKQVDTLKKKGYIVGRLERVIFADPKVKVTNWDATKEIVGVDGKNRRWVYLHYFKAGQPSLNWLDPTFGGNRLIAGDIMESIGELKDSALRIDANPFLGIEKNPGKQDAWSEGHPLAVVSTNLIAMFVRKLGGFTFQELNSQIPDIKTFSKLGADLSYDFISRTAYFHAIIEQDADFLRLNLCLQHKNGISPIRFIHALQNHDELTYELPHFEDNPDKLFKYKDKLYSGKEIRNLIRKQDFAKIMTKKTPYILDSGNGPCSTIVGLCAAAFGIKNIYSMTQSEKDLIKKAHFMLAFYNAMQPGAFMISGWDLVGAYPLKTSKVKNLIKDGDYRWVNRGGYDFLNVNPKAKKSKGNLPKAKTLYGPLNEQLKDPNSFVSQIKKMLKIRKDNQIELSDPVDILEVKNPALYISTYRLSDKSLLLVAVNFARKPISEEVQIDEIKNKTATNIFTDKNIKYSDDKFLLDMDLLGTKAIIFK